MSRKPMVAGCVLLLAAMTLFPGCKQKKAHYAAIPTGPESGPMHAWLTFTSSATDASGDSVAVRFDWGDGDTSAWSAWVGSGSTVTDSHSWATAATYHVCAQARNAAGVNSDWTQPLDVAIMATWTATFGGAADDEGYAVVQSSDGGYVVTGYTSSFGSGSDDIYMIKVDASGNKVWAKTSGGTGNDQGQSIARTSDGGYVIAGMNWTVFIGTKVCLLKLDASGNEVGAGTIGYDGVDIGHSAVQTNDGGYIVAGETDSYGAGQRDVYLIKTDADCNYVWHKVFGGPYMDVGRSVRQTGDGGYIVLGETDATGTGASDIYLIRTDASGNQTWAKTFDGGGADRGYSVQQTSDGGFILVGQTAAGGGNIYLIKTDADGNKVWAKTLGHGQSDAGRSVEQTTDGGYIVAGATAASGSFDAYLLKTDANGDTLWTRIYGGPSGDVAYGVQQTSDGGYIVCGSTQSYGAGGEDVWLIKTDSHGNVAP